LTKIFLHVARRNVFQNPAFVPRSIVYALDKSIMSFTLEVKKSKLDVKSENYPGELKNFKDP